MNINMRKREVGMRKHAKINNGNCELVGSEFGRVRVRNYARARKSVCLEKDELRPRARAGLRCFEGSTFQADFKTRGGGRFLPGISWNSH